MRKFWTAGKRIELTDAYVSDVLQCCAT